VRALLLTNIYPTRENPGGATFIRSRVRALTDLGVEVVPLAIWTTWTAPATVARALLRTADGTPAAGFPGLTAPLGVSQAVRRRLTGRSGSRWLEAVARAALDHAGPGVDVVHAHGMYDLPAGMVAQRVARELGRPYVVSLHGTDANEVLPRRAALYARVLAGAAATCYVSAALRDQAHRFVPAHPAAHVIPNGVDLSLFRPGPRRPAPTVLYVGNLERVKGVDRLPAVWAAVRQAEPDARLRIVGGGSLDARLRRALRDPSVRFVGRLDQSAVAREMAAASVLVLPSRSEGWPSVIMDSYATGTPVVATSVGGVPEAVVRPHHLVPADAAVEQGLAAAVVRTLREGESARAGLTEVAALHSWSRVAEQELALYRSA